MSWRPGGGSGSFRRSGLIDGSTFRRSSGRQSSDDESAGASGSGTKHGSSSTSSFLRMRPSTSTSGDTGASSSSRNISSLLKSSDRSSNLNIPSTSSASSSRSSSFRSSRDNKPVDRSNSWRRSNFSSPVSYFSSSNSSSSDKSKHQVQSPTPSSTSDGDNKSSTLPWSYSSRTYQPLNFTNPFAHSSRDRDISSSRASASERSSSVQPPTTTSPHPPSCPGSEDETGTTSTSTSVSRTPSNASSVSWNPQSNTTSTLPARRKVQKVQLLHLTEPYRELINPSEVVINSSHEVFLAQPVVTPIEQLRRKDKEVAKALEEKQKLIEEILNIPHEELESITETALVPLDRVGHGGQPRTAAEILLSALSQAKSLTSLVNRTLKLSEEEAMHAIALRTQEEKMSSSLLSEQQRIVAKGERLIEITTAINKQLTMLLAIIQENERERESLRRELSRSQDQVRCLLSGDTPWSSPLSPASVSSPLSPITPASISPMPSPLTSKSSSPPLSTSDAGDSQGRNSVYSALSSLSR